MKIPVIVIAGPTASGKSDLAIEAAIKYNGEIISADSMQIYKKLDVGTAKPTLEDVSKVPHHMIDFLDIKEKFSVADYVKRARTIIEDIHKRGKMPIVAGGTGLYIDSLIDGSDFAHKGEDVNLREELTILSEKEGKKAVHDILKELDFAAAQKIHENNLKRVIRAIEIIKTTNKSLSESIGRENKEALYDVLYLYLDHDREILYERINKRVDLMIKKGLLDEALWLYKNSDGTETSVQAIGYKEFFPYFNGEIEKEDAIENLKRDTRHYAKRQMTWFRRNENAKVIDCSKDAEKEAEKMIEEFLERRSHGEK